MTVIAAAEALLHPHLLAVAGAARVQPAAVVEARRVDDERVAFPSADRIPCHDGDGSAGSLRPSMKIWRKVVSTSYSITMTPGE